MKMRYERAVKADEEIKEENLVKEEFTVNNNVGLTIGVEGRLWCLIPLWKRSHPRRSGNGLQRVKRTIELSFTSLFVVSDSITFHEISSRAVIARCMAAEAAGSRHGSRQTVLESGLFQRSKRRWGFFWLSWCYFVNSCNAQEANLWVIVKILILIYLKLKSLRLL